MPFKESYEAEMQVVYEKEALKVFQNLSIVLHEPDVDPSPADLAQFEAMDHAWYRRATDELARAGYTLMRDLDGAPLTAKGAPPSCIRVLRSPDGTTAAALYHVVPASPGAVLKLLLRLLGQWRAARVLELTSTTADDRLVITCNQGDINAFAPGPGVHRDSLPPDTSIADVIAAHERHRARVGAPLRAFASFDAYNAARIDHVARRNAWRAQVGVLPEELDRLLAPHGATGQKIRPHLERLLRERVVQRTGDV